MFNKVYDFYKGFKNHLQPYLMSQEMREMSSLLYLLQIFLCYILSMFQCCSILELLYFIFLLNSNYTYFLYILLKLELYFCYNIFLLYLWSLAITWVMGFKEDWSGSRRTIIIRIHHYIFFHFPAKIGSNFHSVMLLLLDFPSSYVVQGFFFIS